MAAFFAPQHTMSCGNEAGFGTWPIAFSFSWKTIEKVKVAIGRARVLFFSMGELPRSISIPSGRDIEHRPVDLAHWTPNMPRGHEDVQRGGARVTNADDVAEYKSSKTLRSIRLTGSLA